MLSVRLAFWALVIVCALTVPVSAQLLDECPNPERWEPNEAELQAKITDHKKWLEYEGYDYPAIPGKANFCQADLREANLSGAFLREAKLTEAFLFQANLSGADLREANLNGAFLVQADLSGAQLFRAFNLTQEQLDETCGDENTKLPEGLTIKQCPERKE